MEKLLIKDYSYLSEISKTKTDAPTPEHTQHVKEANEKIKENRRREAEISINARNYLSDYIYK